MEKVTVKITFGKRVLYALVMAIALFASFNIALAVFSRSEGWHPLKQITNDTQGTKSVDANENGVVDYAERLTATNSTKIYAPHSRCGSNSVVLLAPTCSTALCSEASYYDCNGDCSQFTPKTCSNTLLGALSPP